MPTPNRVTPTLFEHLEHGLANEVGVDSPGVPVSVGQYGLHLPAVVAIGVLAYCVRKCVGSLTRARTATAPSGRNLLLDPTFCIVFIVELCILRHLCITGRERVRDFGIS